MAKMFYTLDEAAQALGATPDQVKQLASTGKLQQFRDRDKLMFKRDQVDALASAQSGAPADDSGPIPLNTSNDTDAINLADDQKPQPPKGRKEDPRQATGISVFDADEVGNVDPMAQTQVTQPVQDEEEIALASVGSGSGLLDLTRESDDTSLGAELLDEIYPGSPEGSDAKMGSAVAASTGVMDGAVDVSGASGLENLQQGTAPAMVTYVPAAEPYDGAGSGLGAGMLLGVLIGLIIATIVAVSGVLNVPVGLTEGVAGSTNAVLVFTGALLVGAIVFGVVGLLIGMATGKR